MIYLIFTMYFTNFFISDFVLQERKNIHSIVIKITFRGLLIVVFVFKVKEGCTLINSVTLFSDIMTMTSRLGKLHVLDTLHVNSSRQS